MKKTFYFLCFSLTFLMFCTTAQAGEGFYQTIAPQKSKQTEVKGIRLKTQAEVGSVLRMEIAANGSFVVEGIEFVEQKEVLGEVHNYYKVLQKDIFIGGDITSLYCNYWELESVDTSQAPSLKEFNCHDNQSVSLDFSHNTQLKKLVCSLCDLEMLDLSQNTQLEYLDCSENKLTSLNLDNHKKLQILSFQRNKISTFNLSDLTALREFYSDYNLLTSIDCSKNLQLQVLKCNANKLTALDLTNNKELKELQCDQNEIKNFSLNSTSLIEFYISNCKTESLSIIAPNLDLFVCYGNLLTSLDLSKCPLLNALSCHTNKLKTLDLSTSPNLEYIWCNNNQLETLDFSANPRIFSVTCYGNSLQDKEMDKLIETLPTRIKDDMATLILIDTQDESEKNQCTVASVNKAKEKAWSVYDYDGGKTPYPGIPYEGKDTANEIIQKDAISIYPNPTTDYLFLRNNTDNPTEAKLFAEDGRLLLSVRVVSLIEKIDLRSFKVGTYILRVGDQSRVILKR